MFPWSFYTKELYYRVLYITFSIVISFTVAINFIESFFFIEVYSLFKLLHSRLITTHITQILNSIIQVSFFVCCNFSIIFLAYNIISFLSNSLYLYQLQIVKYYLFLILIIWFLNFVLTHILVIYGLFNFFVQSELIQKISTLYINAKLQVNVYVSWVIYVYSCVNFFFTTFLLLFLLITLLISVDQLFLLLKFFRKYITFLLNLVIWMLLPLDFFTQIVIFIMNFCFFELLFLFFCFLTIDYHP